MTITDTLQHEDWCSKRPGADEPRIESYTVPRYREDGKTVASYAR